MKKNLKLGFLFALLTRVVSAQDAPDGWLNRVVTEAALVCGEPVPSVVYFASPDSRVDLCAMADMDTHREARLIANVRADRKFALAVLKAHG